MVIALIVENWEVKFAGLSVVLLDVHLHVATRDTFVPLTTSKVLSVTGIGLDVPVPDGGVTRPIVNPVIVNILQSGGFGWVPLPLASVALMVSTYFPGCSGCSCPVQAPAVNSNVVLYDDVFETFVVPFAHICETV